MKGKEETEVHRQIDGWPQCVGQVECRITAMPEHGGWSLWGYTELLKGQSGLSGMSVNFCPWGALSDVPFLPMEEPGDPSWKDLGFLGP